MLAKCVILICVSVAVHGFNLGPTDVEFHLLTRLNPVVSQPLLPDPNNIAQSNFLDGSRTIFTIHSYGDNVTANFNAFLVNYHLDNENVNVIAVDWSRGASTYTEGVANAPQVGTLIAQFINILPTNFGYSVDQIRIVGVGLGGHIAGIAARQVTGQIPHIIALDPSLIGWTHHPNKLNADDAEIVEVLHTTAGYHGYDYPLGDLDFYPNGGSEQIGCGTDIACSHTYSYAFYAESLSAEVNNAPSFVGTACESYEQAISLTCEGPRDINFGGTSTKRSGSGIYTFVTNPSSPFAQG